MRRKLLCSKESTYQNRELIFRELNYCNPDMVIVLGTSGLKLLGVTQQLSAILDGDCSVKINGKELYVAPFPSGASAIYERYKTKAASIINSKINGD